MTTALFEIIDQPIASGPIKTVNLISYTVASMMSAIYMKQKTKKIVFMVLAVDY